VARFAIPAGTAAGLGVVAAYNFSLSVVKAPLVDSRTVALSVLVIVGLYFVLALEASERHRGRLVLALCGGLLFIYALFLAWGGARDFFDLAVPGVWEIVAILGGAGLTIGGLVLTDERFVPRV